MSALINAIERLKRLPGSLLGQAGTDAVEPSPGAEEPDAVATLREVDVLGRDGSGELSVTDDFFREVAALVDERDAAAAIDALETLLSTDRRTVTVGSSPDGFAARVDDETASAWPGAVAMRTDAAIASAADDRICAWTPLSPRARLAALAEVRSRLDRCPDCEGSLAVEDEPVESTSSTALVCEGCRVQLHESPEATN